MKQNFSLPNYFCIEAETKDYSHFQVGGIRPLSKQKMLFWQGSQPKPKQRHKSFE